MGIIRKNKMDLQEKAELENTAAAAERQQAILDYIAACDHPEIFDDGEEAVEA